MWIVWAVGIVRLPINSSGRQRRRAWAGLSLEKERSRRVMCGLKQVGANSESENPLTAKGSPFYPFGGGIGCCSALLRTTHRPRLNRSIQQTAWWFLFLSTRSMIFFLFFWPPWPLSTHSHRWPAHSTFLFSFFVLYLFIVVYLLLF